MSFSQILYRIILYPLIQIIEIPFFLINKLFDNCVKFAYAKRVLLPVTVLFLLAPSIFAKPSEPEWFKNWRTLYPDSDYIAQRGRGDTEEQAKTDALAQISRYFQTSVNANLTTTLQSVTSGDSVSEKTTVEDEISVMSNVELFGLEYTDGYYFKKEKKWYSVAFIKRETAWNQYKPKIEDAKSAFYAIYDNAATEEDILLRCSMYKKALESGKDFLHHLEYGRILNSEKEADYKNDRKTVSEIPSLIEKEKNSCTIFIDIQGDYEKHVQSALMEVFKESGFRVVRSEAEAAYNCKTYVELNQSGAEPLSIKPGLEIRIENNQKNTIFSEQINSQDKTLAYSLEKAQKKAFPLFAEKISEVIKTEFADRF